MITEWMKSREHLENIQKVGVDATGIGVVHECGGCYYATQIFTG
jgi:uncharacterized protein YkwD